MTRRLSSGRERAHERLAARAGARQLDAPPAVGLERDRQLEPVGGRGVGEAVEPLDGDGRAIEGVVEPELLELGAARDAIEIGVDERDAPRVLVDERERRARDVAVGRHARPARQPLHERRLAGPERPDERHDVPGAQRAPEALAQRLHRLRGLGAHDGRGAHGVRA